MKAARFDLVRPRSLPDALAALADGPEESRVLAGGQSLVALMALRLSRPDLVIDLNEISELSGIDVTPDHVEIGAMTRQHRVETDPEIASTVPLLAEAVGLIGHRTIRNRGTIGGSLAHADPAAELPAVAVALGAQFVIQRAGASRVVPADEFFQGPFDTCLEPTEILTGVRFDRGPASRKTTIVEHSRRSGDFAVAGVAMAIDLADDDTITAARIVGFGIDPVPQRSTSAESMLVGQHVADHNAAEAAAHELAAGCSPTADIHASAPHRRRVAAEMLRRALSRCGEPVGAPGAREEI